MSEAGEVDLALKEAVRTTPDLIETLRKKLMEGLEATEIKTCSYQGNMTWESFTDYVTRLNYIKAIIDIGELSKTNFAASEGATGLNAVERIRRLLDTASERAAAVSKTE